VVPCNSGNIWNASEVMEHPVALCSNPFPVSDWERIILLIVMGASRGDLMLRKMADP